MANRIPHSARPRKRFGQNFLRDQGVVRRILDALEPEQAEAVLEIGPGRGALTLPCLERVPRMAAVEIDRDLAASWRERFTESRLLLIEDDALQVRLDEIARRLDARRLRIVGNLPYNISKPISMRWIEQAASIERGVFMYQKEVAARLTAATGSRDYGPLGILAGWVFDVRRLFVVPPSAFTPAPKVDSAVTLWSPRSDPPSAELLQSGKTLLRAAFAHRRKMLAANLKGLYGAARSAEWLERAGIDAKARAETVPSELWLRMAGWAAEP